MPTQVFATARYKVGCRLFGRFELHRPFAENEDVKHLFRDFVGDLDAAPFAWPEIEEAVPSSQLKEVLPCGLQLRGDVYVAIFHGSLPIRLPIIPQMRLDSSLVELGAPAGARRGFHKSINDLWGVRRQIVLPRDIVNVYLHDSHVR